MSFDLSNGLPLYFELQDKIDALLVALEECYESMNSITIWQHMNGMVDDCYQEEFRESMMEGVKQEFGDEPAELIEKLLFD